MKTRVFIRLALHTDLGTAGFRLEREMPLPIEAFDFPDTPQGRADAEEARRKLQSYIDTHHDRRKS
jgi:hypothetical protein